MSSIHNVIALLNQTKPGYVYHDIACTFLKHIRDIDDNLSLQDVADMCFTSPTTISRFVKKVGYSDFSEFKVDLLHYKSRFPFYNWDIPGKIQIENLAFTNLLAEQAHRLIDEFQNTVDETAYHAIVDAVHAAEQVNFYMNTAYNVSSFQINLFLDGKGCRICSTEMEQFEDAALLNERSMVFLLFPADAAYQYLPNLIDSSKRAGAKTCLITSNGLTPYGADYFLSFCGSNTPIRNFCFDAHLMALSTLYRAKYMG